MRTQKIQEKGCPTYILQAQLPQPLASVAVAGTLAKATVGIGATHWCCPMVWLLRAMRARVPRMVRTPKASSVPLSSFPFLHQAVFTPGVPPHTSQLLEEHTPSTVGHRNEGEKREKKKRMKERGNIRKKMES